MFDVFGIYGILICSLYVPAATSNTIGPLIPHNKASTAAWNEMKLGKPGPFVGSMVYLPASRILFNVTCTGAVYTVLLIQVTAARYQVLNPALVLNCGKYCTGLMLVQLIPSGDDCHWKVIAPSGECPVMAKSIGVSRHN